MIARVERDTVGIYEKEAATYAARRPPKHRARAAAFAETVSGDRPLVDIGCGPGGYVPDLQSSDPPVVALDAAFAMLELTGATATDALRVQADVSALPFRAGSLGGAWARNTYLHIRRADLPLALAHLHRSLAIGAPILVSVVEGDAEGPIPGDVIPGRFFADWRRDALEDVVIGAGFELGGVELVGDELWVTATRARRLPDFVGGGMKLLVCGLNPSVVAADAGFGYAGSTNRFWPAAIEAGVVSRPRDPFHALQVDRIGMTDLVKRATPRASDLAADEYQSGAGRVRRLVEWLRPRAVVFVGLSGWRAAIDRRAVAGPQPGGFAGVPAYVMPSTSGLNAHARLADLVAHLKAALVL